MQVLAFPPNDHTPTTKQNTQYPKGVDPHTNLPLPPVGGCVWVCNRVLPIVRFIKCELQKRPSGKYGTGENWDLACVIWPFFSLLVFFLLFFAGIS